ncbi:MAG TPA: cellulose synthase subunit BcsC-related outer membrane protein [Methylococcaceae bacterium]|nr:cellulose synthase subunit BcsC-related outer membrane protein [Methylococcaceae bacterium]
MPPIRYVSLATLIFACAAAAEESITRTPDSITEIRKEPGAAISQTPETKPGPQFPQVPQESQPAAPRAAGEVSPPARATRPDERVLWRLYDQRRFGALQRKIREYRTAYPGWRPPRKLLGLVAQEQERINLRSALKQNNPSGLIQIFEEHPKVFGCSDPDTAWSVAAAYGDGKQWQKAARIYGDLILRCSLAIARASLQKASLILPDAEFEGLRAAVAASPHASELMETSRDTAYERRKRALLIAHQTADHLALDRLKAELVEEIEARKDAGMAGLLGWDHFDRGRYDEAIRWFHLALDWEPQHEDWRYGLALSQMKAQRPEAAAQTIGSVPSSQRLRRLLGDLRMDRAWDAFRRDDLDAADENLAQARPYLSDKRDADTLDAWLHYRRGEYAEAAARFEQLYREKPSPELAEGLVLSYAKSAPQRLDNLPGRDLEQMKSAIAAQQAGELYGRKLFLTTHAATPKFYPDLENIDSGSVAVGTMVRNKSGEAGMGRLTIWERPFAEGVYVHDRVNRFAFKAAALDLNSGRPGDCDGFGSKPESCSDFGLTQLRAPLAGVHDAALLDFSYYREGWASPYFSVGTTPLNGPVSPVPTFRLGLVQQESWGRWQADAFNQPVRLSMLSYVGQKDPYSSTTWGRVVQTGGTFNAYHQIDERWGLNAELTGAYLSGQHVADNWMVGASVAIGYDLKLPDFDYFSLGPSVLYQHYDRTLSHFTLGQGGYFSPDQFVNTGLGVNFLTEEGRPFIVRGRMTVGYQYFNESASPWFPLGAPTSLSNGNYSSNRVDGIAYDLEVKGAWLVTPNWMIAAGGAVRQTSGYQDYFGGLSIGFLFDSRKAAFSSDIPDSFFRALY